MASRGKTLTRAQAHPRIRIYFGQRYKIFAERTKAYTYMQGNRIKKRGRLTTLELPGSWHTCIFNHRCSCMSIAL